MSDLEEELRDKIKEARKTQYPGEPGSEAKQQDQQ